MTDALFLADVGTHLDAVALGSSLTITGDEARHAVSVRRIRVGESVLIADGCGLAAHGRVTSAEKASLTIQVDEVLATPTSPWRWVAVQALAKGDRSDLAVETLTELGVDEVMAWQASRSIVRWQGKTDKGLAKWQATAKAATKQSRRFRVPEVSYASTAEVVARIRAADCALVLHEEATTPISRASLPVTAEGPAEVLFVVGPEGGLSPDELSVFADAGAQVVSISDGVLRASTAGVVALSPLQFLAQMLELSEGKATS